MKGITLRLLLVSSLVISSAMATEALEKVIDKSEKISNSAINSQTKIDKISDDIDTKVQQFKSVTKETDGLIVYNSELDKQIANQLQEMENLNASIDRVSVIERQITPLMLRMIKGLEDFVSLDVPFLPEERAKRLTFLKDMMSRADVEVSEKFRRVLEAYQVEVDYGRTIEAYTAQIAIDGSKPQDVNFLRIGRVSLIYQSRDRQQMGIWNQETKQWDKLDDSFRASVAKGLRIARKQQAPDMIKLPVFAAK